MMENGAVTLGGYLGAARSRAADYLALAKPRVVAMVLLTSLVGFDLANRGGLDVALALKLLVGTALSAAGTLALNQYVERDSDARMKRTRHRPLPGGRLYPAEALAFGAGAMVAGWLFLWLETNPLTAALTAAISAVYLLGYTPLKPVSWLAQMVGAVPGALPPVAGWAAARATLGFEPWLLFAIMFLWQLPHSLAIARLYEADYTCAGIRLWPPDGPRGNPATTLIVADSAVLLAAGVTPALLGLAGRVYLVAAIALGAMMVVFSLRLRRETKAPQARRLMLASLVYLPALFLALVIDRM